MRDDELIKAIDKIGGISKDKYMKEEYPKKVSSPDFDVDFGPLLEEEMDKLKKEEQRKEQLIRLRNNKAYINILQNTYEEELEKMTRHK